MCGIAGIFHGQRERPVDAALVRAMTDSMTHRGPDGSGVWTAPGIGLGHRRLSIIDLAGGAQPMLSEDESLAVTFNGEIYNFQAVRAELERLGHRFVSHSDTEVILHGWRQWGTDCVTRFDGMFAFALYDRTDGTLFLVRDRLGVKPLFYRETDTGGLAFASELKGLLADPDMRRVPDLTAIDDFLAWGYVPDQNAIIQGVAKLPAGHWLLIEHGRPVPSPVQYWDVDYSRRAAGTGQSLGEELIALMTAAVRSRMIADVPLGAFLSGGVDSSSVVALMAEASDRPVQTCSIGFDAAGLDESDYAARIADLFGTDHRMRRVGADDFSLIDTLSHHFDEPFADASALPTWRVCELARENVTVALSGDGADEALAGYRRHVFHAGEERVRDMLPRWLRRPMLGGLGALYPKADWAPRPLRAKATLLALAGDGDAAYVDAVGVTNATRRRGFYSEGMRRDLGDYRAEDRMLALMAGAPARSGLDRAQYADMKLWLPGDILTKVDRTSMGVSLEAREPLLDHRLVEFAATLPDDMRVRGRHGKFLMKRAMQGRLPDDILYRPKMGFVTPIAAWFRGPLAATARGIADQSALARTGWFDPAALRELADNHISGRADNARQLWQFLMLDKAVARLFG